MKHSNYQNYLLRRMKSTHAQIEKARMALHHAQLKHRTAIRDYEDYVRTQKQDAKGSGDSNTPEKPEAGDGLSAESSEKGKE